MFERPQHILKLACLIFGAVLLVQFGLLIKRGDPLRRLAIPALPTLAGASETNSVAAKGAEKKGTNSAASKEPGKPGTNAAASIEWGKNGTNSASIKEPGKNGTNAAPQSAKGATNSTSETAKAGTNSIPASSEKGSTNAVSVEASKEKDTKPVVLEEASKGASNAISLKEPGKNATNSAASKDRTKSGTNSLAMEKGAQPGTNSSAKGGTNALSPQELAKKGRPPGGRPEPGKAPADLPPLIKARIERITQSEIFGQIIRPMPMALLGIADTDIFLRAPDGQTGRVKEGGELGGVKLLRIGTNRVLIEHEGEKKELTLFSGFGSETLLPKPTERTNETTKTKP